MADYLHQLEHNKTRSNRSLVSPQVSEEWRRRMAQELNIRYVAPAEASDDPWGEVIHPTSADLGVQ
jgi:hypothetical protein